MANTQTVNLRKGILMCLEYGVEKAMAGDGTQLKRTLNTLQERYAGYSVRKLQGDDKVIIEDQTHKKEDRPVLIMEGNHVLFIIYRCKKTMKTKVDFLHRDLIAQEQFAYLYSTGTPKKATV